MEHTDPTMESQVLLLSEASCFLLTNRQRNRCQQSLILNNISRVMQQILGQTHQQWSQGVH